MSNLDLTNLSKEQLIAMIEAAKKQQTSRITFKVSEKGCVSVYGLNTRGIHLYASQWQRILENAELIQSFIAKNRDKLAWKNAD